MVEAVRTGYDAAGQPVTEPAEPGSLLRLNLPAELAVPGQEAWVTVLVRVQAALGV